MKDIIGRKLLMATLFAASITSFAGCYTGAIITREMIWKTGTLFEIIASAIGTMARIKMVCRTRREK